MKKPKVIILRAAGTNCDQETAFAFQKVGAEAELVHINQLVSGEKELRAYQIFAIPGGFTYGDDIASGKILANELRYKLGDDLERFIRKGNLIIGICNGFQILVKAGLLPNLSGRSQIEATLTLNDSARFEASWVYLKKQDSRCIWTKGLLKDVIYLPIAHGEGKFMAKDQTILKLLDSEGLTVLKYEPVNPNGSMENIAGICDQTGRVFGLMPHPERHIEYTQHPRWTRGYKEKEGDGLAIFRSGVEYARRML